MIVLVLPVFAAEPNFAREARMADEIVDAILDGDPEWLEADGRKFLSIFIPDRAPRCDHYFTDQGEGLVVTITKWLRSLEKK